VSAWSTRTGFPVGSLTVLHTGELVFGHNLGAEAAQEGEPPPEAGLFVVSARRALGGYLDPGEQNKFIYNDPPVSKYRSAWLDMGDAQVQKQVLYTTLWIMTTGDVTITIKHLKDFNYVAVAERTYLCQPPDATALPVFDKTIIGQDQYENKRLIPLRVSVAQLSCAHYAFEFTTDEDISFVGWEVEYVSKGVRVIAGQRAT